MLTCWFLHTDKSYRSSLETVCLGSLAWDSSEPSGNCWRSPDPDTKAKPSWTLPVSITSLVNRRRVVVIEIVRRHWTDLWSRGTVSTSRVVLGRHQPLMVVARVHYPRHVVGEESARVVLRFHRLTLPPEASRTPPERTFFEHELTRWINCPVMSLAWSAETFGQLDETLVQR